MASAATFAAIQSWASTTTYLVGERRETAVPIAVFLVGATNFMGEIVFHMLRGGAIEAALDEMHRHVRQGIDAGRAIQGAGLGDKELTLQVNRRICGNSGTAVDIRAPVG